MLMDGDESSFRNKSVPKRILSSLIGSIAAGVVPRTGAPYIAIGEETKSPPCCLILKRSVRAVLQCVLLSDGMEAEKAF